MARLWNNLPDSHHDGEKIKGKSDDPNQDREREWECVCASLLSMCVCVWVWVQEREREKGREIVVSSTGDQLKIGCTYPSIKAAMGSGSSYVFVPWQLRWVCSFYSLAHSLFQACSSSSSLTLLTLLSFSNHPPKLQTDKKLVHCWKKQNPMMKNQTNMNRSNRYNSIVSACFCVCWLIPKPLPLSIWADHFSNNKN